MVLTMVFSLAEKMVTMVFEPWGGSFVIARIASRVFGWTNSQPLNLVDGYDLDATEGEARLFDILDHHDPVLTVIAFDCRTWSILTSLNSELDWDGARETKGVP